jgi:hypothetical protein
VRAPQELFDLRQIEQRCGGTLHWTWNEAVYWRHLLAFPGRPDEERPASKS